MFAAIVLIPPLTFIYHKLNLVDMPSPRKVHSVPIPRVGGVAIVIASMIPFIGWVTFDMSILGMLVGVAILFVLGVIDDARNLSYKSKFLVQIASITLIFASGFIDIMAADYVVDDLLISPVLLAIYFIFILGVTNAINLADGLDGLAGGEALLSFSIIGLLAYESNNSTIVLMVLAVIGAIFGFLRFNTYPAKIFMGDTGSLFLGFMLGVLSVALTYGADNAYAKTLPLLLVGLPIFDTIMVMFIRIYNKQSPFNADRNHLHHKLLDHGYKHYHSVLIIYLIQSVFILTAYFMRYDTDLNIILAFLFRSSLAFILSLVHSRKRSLVENSYIDKTLSLGKQYVIRNANKLFILLAVLMVIYVVSSLFEIRGFENDILILLATITALAMFSLIFMPRKPCSWIERVAIHVMIVMSIYFGAQANTSILFNIIHLGLLLACVGLIIILFLGDASKRIFGSPLDFLLIATAIVIPNLPNSPVSDSGLSILIIKLTVLFYCVEYILFNVKNNWWAIRTTLALSACIPVFVSFL